MMKKETTPIQTEGEMRANTKIVKELLERKVAPQVEKQSKEKLTRVQELLLKFDTNPKVVRTVKTQAQVKPKQVETVMDVNSIASNRSIEFRRQKTIPSCGDSLNLSIVKKSVVQKQEDVQEEEAHDVQEVRGVQKQENEKHLLEQITARGTGNPL